METRSFLALLLLALSSHTDVPESGSDYYDGEVVSPPAERLRRATPPTSIPEPRCVPSTGPTSVQNSGPAPKISLPWVTRCSASSGDCACCTTQSLAPRSRSSCR